MITNASELTNVNNLEQIVKDSTSIRGVLIKLGLAPQGGNYKTIQKKIAALGLDDSHFTGQSHRKGSSIAKQDISLYLTNQRRIGSHRLKQRLIREGLLEPICSKCNNKEWLGQPIPLELEHRDGNHENNNLDNITLLCPNCHAQTETYRGGNKKRADPEDQKRRAIESRRRYYLKKKATSIS